MSHSRTAAKVRQPAGSRPNPPLPAMVSSRDHTADQSTSSLPGAAGDDDGAARAEQAQAERHAGRGSAAVDDGVEAAVEDGQLVAGDEQAARPDQVGGAVEELRRAAPPDPRGPERLERARDAALVDGEVGGQLATAPAGPLRPARVDEHGDVDVGVEAAQRGDHQPGGGARADHPDAVAAAIPAQHRVDRRGQRHAEDAALVGDAVGGDEHLLVGEHALRPAAAGGEPAVGARARAGWPGRGSRTARPRRPRTARRSGSHGSRSRRWARRGRAGPRAPSACR